LNRGSGICSPVPYHLAMAPDVAACPHVSEAPLRSLFTTFVQSLLFQIEPASPGFDLRNGGTDFNGYPAKTQALWGKGRNCLNSRYAALAPHGAMKAISDVGAANETRTRYLHLGKVALYQMSYGRIYFLLKEKVNKEDFKKRSVFTFLP
jgi:hypothetical protein